jgi:hypothetical protein
VTLVHFKIADAPVNHHSVISLPVILRNLPSCGQVVT